MTKVLNVGRNTIYNRINLEEQRKREISESKKKEIISKIENIVLEYARYGYRRVTKELRKREGLIVNHKRVLQLMRENNLLCKAKRRFVVTTNSNHTNLVYPNLIENLVPLGINQIWVADITYVHLPRGFCYLAVIIDLYSRKIIGWSLGEDITEELTIKALNMALETRDIYPGLIHHSDRGVQYASNKYTDLLKNNGISISMSRKGNPYDNAYAESFMKTIKYEEIYLNEYDTLEQARINIGHFIEDVYNRKRLHSSIGYLPPVEFEEQLQDTKLKSISVPF